MKKAIVLTAVAVAVLVVGAWVASRTAESAVSNEPPQTAFALRNGPECVCPWAREEPTCDGPGSPIAVADTAACPEPSCDGHCGCKGRAP